MKINVPEYTDYKKLLQKRLTAKRYNHSLCVAQEAYRLALKYGADEQKAYLAGLLHDITKNAPDTEHLNIFNKFGIMLNDIEFNSVKLWHAISGSAYIEHILNINDTEIISAVRYHTTARKGIKLLEKILYLADFTSADRDYDDVDVLRALVDESLEKAYVYALSYSVKELVDKTVPIHTDTFEAYNEAVKGKNLWIR